MNKVVFVTTILQISKEMLLLHISNDIYIIQSYQLCAAFLFFCVEAERKNMSELHWGCKIHV